MVPTLETKDLGRDILKGDKRTLYTAVWPPHLSSNHTKHIRAAEETHRPNQLPIAGGQGSFGSHYLPPSSALAPVFCSQNEPDSNS